MIDVFIVTGALGSGKSTLINYCLSNGLDASAIIVNEAGSIGIDHHILTHSSDSIRLIEGGCMCCTLQQDLSATLRSLFMQAMQKQLPRFERVIIETSGLADPASIIFTLKHDVFLKDRFAYAGCLTVVDAQHINKSALWWRQLASADVLLINQKAASQEQLKQLNNTLEPLPIPALRFNGDHVFNGNDPITVPRFFAFIEHSKEQSPRFSPLFEQSIPSSLPMTSLTSGVKIYERVIDGVQSRLVFTQKIDQLVSRYGKQLLRLKALVQFEDGYYHIHAVHETRYPVKKVALNDNKPICGLVLMLDASLEIPRNPLNDVAF